MTFGTIDIAIYQARTARLAELRELLRSWKIEGLGNYTPEVKLDESSQKDIVLAILDIVKDRLEP